MFRNFHVTGIRMIAVVLVMLCCAASAGAQHVVILGDSNTWLGGDGCDNPQGWTKWFKDRLRPQTCRSYARSGATWTHTPATVYNVVENIGVLGDDNVIYNQANRLMASCDSLMQPVPDIIMIAAGTNDAWFLNRRRGALEKTAAQAFSDTALCERQACEVLTLAESVIYVCTMLKRRFPDCRIILLTPLQTTATSLERIMQVGSIIDDCAAYVGADVIRQDILGCVSRGTELRHHIYTVDGTHTNEAGAEINGNMVAEKVFECKLR